MNFCRFYFSLFTLILLLALSIVKNSVAQSPDSISSEFDLGSFDPFAIDALSDTNDEAIDNLKSADQLITEADFLLEDQRPLDGRTKLMRALKKEPGNYRAYMLLSGYYLVHVGHFKLALRYIRKSQDLFIAQNGQPPYEAKRTQAEHAYILYLLSQARLNLDDYKGSLEVLERFAALDYKASWYAGTKAWTLMKLGKIQDAIKVARLGVIEGSEPGRTLNMLGILLSMSGQPAEALKIFKEAISYEFSMGSLGQPATPLNNSGEVFKEMFDDERAESNWLRATSLPDGCEHYLPTLNVSLLYFEQMNLEAVKRAIKTFEQCIAQYPLRNGEEHKALLSFTQGKVLQLSGNPQKSLSLFENANKSRQWFGKIGTSQDDLKAAVTSALSMTHFNIANRLKFFSTENWYDLVINQQKILFHKLASWWLKRKASRLLTEEMGQLEDINIRNTDSLLEYPTLGFILSGLSPDNLQRRIELEKKTDNRPQASVFYQAYLAESLIEHNKTHEGIFIIDQSLPLCRDRFDVLLKTHLLALRLQHIPINSKDYVNLGTSLFKLNRIGFRNYGFALPVQLTISDNNFERIINKAGFINNPLASEFKLSISNSDGQFVANADLPVVGKMRLTSDNLSDLLNRLNDTIFTEDIL